MWLVDVDTLKLKEFFDSEAPPYAILSHVWDSDEISFQEMGEDPKAHQLKAGFQKILRCCAIANNLDIRYAWIDTCCIDKRNIADLSEAINSMYRYYSDAVACLVYFADVPGRQQTDGSTISGAEQLQAARSSRWFTRGWTLQELVATTKRHFFAQDWSLIPLISDEQDLLQLISEVTKIGLDLLTHKKSVSSYCIAERMSWASTRETTRSEDIAYSLMGLFNVNMPLLYGEGSKKAFRRLQKEIIQTSFDQTIFAWRGNYESSGLLAKSPSDFANTPSLGLWAPDSLEPWSMTNIGLSISMVMKPEMEYDDGRGIMKGNGKYFLGALQCDIKVGQEWMVLMVPLLQIEGVRAYANGKTCNVYRRVNCTEWITHAAVDYWPYEAVLILEDENYQLIVQSEQEHQSRWAANKEVESRIV